MMDDSEDDEDAEVAAAALPDQAGAQLQPKVEAASSSADVKDDWLEL